MMTKPNNSSNAIMLLVVQDVQREHLLANLNVMNVNLDLVKSLSQDKHQLIATSQLIQQVHQLQDALYTHQKMHAQLADMAI